MISVITVCLNPGAALETTIKSVLSQPRKDIEYIVIDGGSTDGSDRVLEQYGGAISSWESEPDDGIYHAMNKGISRATGDALLFLNAGDSFVGDVLTNDMPVPCFLPVRIRNHFGRYVEMPVRSSKQGLPICHQGIVFENLGHHYDMRYTVGADYEYFLRHGYDESLPRHYAPGYVHYDNTGFSVQNRTLRDAEIAEIIRSRYGNAYYTIFQLKVVVKNIARRVLQ